MKRKLRQPCLAVSMAVACFTPHARAFDRFWNSFSSGNFTDATKWVGNAIPGSTDAAFFRVFGGTPGPYSITFPGHTIFQGTANYANDTLTIGPNTVSFLQSSQLNLGPSTYTLANAIHIGEGTGLGVLNSSLSILSAPTVSLGYLAGSPATLNINAGSFNVTGSAADYQLRVGDNATSTLNVNANSQMNVSGIDGGAAIGLIAGVSGNVNIAGAGAIWNNTSDNETATLSIGRLGTGTLNITAGGQVNNAFCVIGDQLGSIGNASVTGANSIWNNRNALTVGSEGTGTLTISGGGQVSCLLANLGSGPQAGGSVQMSGAGSLFIQSGNLNIGGTFTNNGSSGTGVMMLTTGAMVSTGGDAFVGSSGIGIVQLFGNGTKWNVAGQLNVSDTGAVTTADLSSVVCNTAAVAGIVSMHNAAVWNVNDFLQVSNTTIFGSNVGTVNLTSGAQVNNRVAFIAAGGFGGRGLVTVDGAGSTWNTTDQLYVGLLGGGSFKVTNGGKVTSGECQLGVNNGSTGIISVDGADSTWTTALNMDVGIVGTGNITASHSGLVTVNGLLSIGPKGTIEGNSVFAANVRNGGSVAPGISASANPADKFAKLLITGDYTQTAAGKLKIDLHTTSEHDTLAIKGDATLAGSLEITQAPGFAPIPGDRYTALAAVHRTGVFDSTAGLSTGTFQLVPIYSPTDVVIFVAAVGEKTWGIDANGNSSVPANWIGGAPNAVDDKVAFSTVITADRTVTVDTPFTAGSIYFDGSSNYLVQGPGAITLDVAATGNVLVAVKNLHGGGTHTIAAPLTLNDSTTLDIAAASTLRITQQVTAVAGIAVTKIGAGMLAMKNVRADGLLVGAGALQIIPAGGAAGTSIVKALTIAPTATLDLNNNDLLIDYTGATPYTTIRNYLLTGLNTGTGGIVSSTGQSAGNTIHAIVDNAHLHRTTWNGLPIDDTTIIAKYTLKGDANLDGTVGFADLVTVAQNYGNNTGQTTWDTGDFNYDGNVGFADLVAIAQNYGGSLPTSPIAGASNDFDHDLQAAFASVPEPSFGFGIVSLVIPSFLRRHRAKQQNTANDAWA